MQPPKKQTFDVVPAGNHVARLYQIIHIGTVLTIGQFGEKMQDKVRLTFELCNEKKEFKAGEGEKPFSVSREFTYSYHLKGLLRPFVDGMTGTKMRDDEFPDLEALLGDACLLNVVHDVKETGTYANIQNASPLPKGMEAPALVNETRIFDINTITQEELVKLPEFIQKKMRSSEEYAARFSGAGEEEVGGELLPKIAPTTSGPQKKPGVVVQAEMKADKEKKEIYVLCDEIAQVPLLSDKEHNDYIFSNTGLVFGQAPAETIIERLKAL
jgi:hypothetical protein